MQLFPDAALRHHAVAAHIDARRAERSVRLLGRGRDVDGGAGLKFALVADFIANDRNGRPDDDLLLPVLILHRDYRAVDAAHGLAHGAVRHSAAGLAIPFPPMAIAEAALRLVEDLHFHGLLGAVR